MRRLWRAGLAVAVLTAAVVPLGMATATPASADVAPATNYTPHYTVTHSGVTAYDSNSLSTDGLRGATSGTTTLSGAAIGGIIGDHYSPTGSGCEEISLTRNDCYIFFCHTIYEAHLTTCWSWNVLAYGGVVFNVGWLMWADHFDATISSDPPAYLTGYFTYKSAYGNTSGVGGYSVQGVMNIKQCIPACVQSETVVAYVHMHDDGSWIADINHS